MSTKRWWFVSEKTGNRYEGGEGNHTNSTNAEWCKMHGRKPLPANEYPFRIVHEDDKPSKSLDS